MCLKSYFYGNYATYHFITHNNLEKELEAGKYTLLLENYKYPQNREVEIVVGVYQEGSGTVTLSYDK